MFSVIERTLNLDAVKLDTLYLVKLIIGEYFCYFDTNRVAVLLQLQLYLDANGVLVRERVNNKWEIYASVPSLWDIYTNSIMLTLITPRQLHSHSCKLQAHCP